MAYFWFGLSLLGFFSVVISFLNPNLGSKDSLQSYRFISVLACITPLTAIWRVQSPDFFSIITLNVALLAIVMLYLYWLFVRLDIKPPLTAIVIPIIFVFFAIQILSLFPDLVSYRYWIGSTFISLIFFYCGYKIYQSAEHLTLWSKFEMGWIGCIAIIMLVFSIFIKQYPNIWVYSFTIEILGLNIILISWALFIAPAKKVVG